MYYSTAIYGARIQMGREIAQANAASMKHFSFPTTAVSSVNVIPANKEIVIPTLAKQIETMNLDRIKNYAGFIPTGQRRVDTIAYPAQVVDSRQNVPVVNPIVAWIKTIFNIR